jgi:hypothetical protein
LPQRCAQDDVRKVDVVISDREAVPVERFAFSLEDCGQGQAQAQARAGGIAVPYTIDPAELRKALRNLLTRLNYADSLMDALPDGVCCAPLVHRPVRASLPLLIGPLPSPCLVTAPHWSIAQFLL